VTPAILVLRRAEPLIVGRMEELEPRLSQDDSAAWLEYGQLAANLAAIVVQTAPGAGGRLMTTAEMAAALGVTSKTVLRKRKDGELTAIQLGKRGRAALRWKIDAAARR
jgi:excisionase family DNA binding protein